MKIKFANDVVAMLDDPVTNGATSFNATIITGFDGSFPSLSAGEAFFLRFGEATQNTTVIVTASTGGTTGTFTCNAISGDWAAGTNIALMNNAETMALLLQEDGQGQTATGHKFIGYHEGLEDHGTIAASGTVNIPWDTGPGHKVTLGGAGVTIDTATATNPPSGAIASQVIHLYEADTYPPTFAAKFVKEGYFPALEYPHVRLVMETLDGGTTVLLSYAGGWSA